MVANSKRFNDTKDFKNLSHMQGSFLLPKQGVRTMQNEICIEKHKRVDENYTHHDNWLHEHEVSIDALQKSDARNTAVIANLCTQLGGLTKAIWGLILTLIVALLGFFFWAVQNGIIQK